MRRGLLPSNSPPPPTRGSREASGVVRRLHEAVFVVRDATLQHDLISVTRAHWPNMVHIEFDLHEGALASVRQDPETFTRELRIAAAVKWYEMRRVSQGRAAEIAGVSRAEFIDALGRYGVSPFQQTAEEIVHDAEEDSRG